MEASLKDKPVGEVAFRPSSKGPSHLTATVKISDRPGGPYLHIDIAEENKPSQAEIGRQLFVGRAEGEEGERLHAWLREGRDDELGSSHWGIPLGDPIGDPIGTPT